VKLSFSITLFYPEVKNKEKTVTGIVTELLNDGFVLHRFVMDSVLLKKGKMILEVKRGEHPEVLKITLTGWSEFFEEFYLQCKRVYNIIGRVLQE